MRARRRPITGFAAVLTLVAALVAASCGHSAESWEGQVTISVDLEAGQRWTTVGSPVDRGAICPNGIRHVIDAVDPMTGEVVPVRVWFWVIQDAISERNTTAIVLVVEYTCTDGSGSFVTREEWGADVWSVESGTGTYRELRGGGELSFATMDYTMATPLRLFADGVLAG